MSGPAVHFPHGTYSTKSTPWGAPGEAMVIATCREGWGRCSVAKITQMSILDTWWTLVKIERRHSSYNVSSCFLWGRLFLHLLWTHLHNSPLNYGFVWILGPFVTCSLKKVQGWITFKVHKGKSKKSWSSIIDFNLILYTCIYIIIYIYRKYMDV